MLQQPPGVHGGTGIGLALVAQIMANHNGYAQIDPLQAAPGKGTKVDLVFPTYREAPQA